jgi:hypothetical protein
MFAKTLYFVVLAGATAAATRPDGSKRRMLRSFNQLFATIADCRRVLATAVDDWSGKPYCVSS